MGGGEQLMMDGNQMKPDHEQIANLAYRLWEQRGRPIGSPEQDWRQAEYTISLMPEVLEERLQSSLAMGPGE